jgi:hypothetical protein
VATKAQQFEALLDKYAPQLAAAFREGISDLAENADLKAMTAALRMGDVESALTAMHLDPAAFLQYEEAFRTVFLESAVGTANQIPTQTDVFGNPVRFRFYARSPLAEEWLRDYSSTFVRGIVAETRDTLRMTMIRSLSLGKNPTAIVAETVGRVSRATGRREGGYIGLTTPQATAVTRAGEELSSGDPGAWNDYRERKRRDKRYDARIKDYLTKGEPVPPSLARQAMDGYRNGLLAARAKLIGRTETMTALNQGQHKAIEVAIAEGKVSADAITKIWRSAHDTRVRLTHAELDGNKQPWDAPFVAISGAQLRFPMDRSLGAPASELIGCRCRCEYSFSMFAGVR